jgi:hypothetical protein
MHAGSIPASGTIILLGKLPKSQSEQAQNKEKFL